MSVTVQARLDGMNWSETVEATGSTLASAVRAAVRKLGIGPGRTLSSEKVGSSQWRWNWSGTTIHVVQSANRESLTNAHRGRRMVTVTLSDAAHQRLDAMAEEHGETRSGMVERLVLAAG